MDGLPHRLPVNYNKPKGNQMRIDKRHLAPIHCASKDSTRYNLNGVHFDGHCIEATDGHVLARVVLAEDNRMGPITPFLVPLDDVQTLQKKIGRYDVALNEGETASNGHSAWDGAEGKTLLQKVSEDDVPYPKIDAVHSRPDDAHTEYSVGLSVAVLEKIVATARQYGKTKKGGIQALTFRFRDPLSPVFIEVSAQGDPPDGTTLEMTVMPMRVD